MGQRFFLDMDAAQIDALPNPTGRRRSCTRWPSTGSMWATPAGAPGGSDRVGSSFTSFGLEDPWARLGRQLRSADMGRGSRWQTPLHLRPAHRGRLGVGVEGCCGLRPRAKPAPKGKPAGGRAHGPRDDLGLRVLRGGRLLVLASTAILARILTPDDFGLVALALTFMALLEGVANLGLGQALVVQKGEDIRERANSVFFAGVALGLTLSVTIAALSPFIASFFDQPDLESLTIVLGANFLLRSSEARITRWPRRSSTFERARWRSSRT